MIYAKSSIEWIYTTKEASETSDCIVTITPESILVTYLDEGYTISFLGSGKNGHYELQGDCFKGTLHCLEDSKLLVGTWAEKEKFDGDFLDGVHTWIIRLEDED